MVSNRSTYRQGTASRESQKRNSNAFASNQEDPLQQEDDGFAQPMPEMYEESESQLAGLSSSRSQKKKKGKKKKKRSKKASALAAIDEDLKDQSAGEDDNNESPKVVNHNNDAAPANNSGGASGEEADLLQDAPGATEIQANGAATGVAAGEPVDNNNDFNLEADDKSDADDGAFF